MRVPWELVEGPDYSDSLRVARARTTFDAARFAEHLDALRRDIARDPFDEFSEALATPTLRVRHTEDRASGYAVFVIYTVDVERWQCHVNAVDILELDEL